MTLMNRIYCLFIFIILLLTASCGGSDNSTTVNTTEPYQYRQPIMNNDGWTTSHVNDLDIDPTSLVTLMDNINSNRHGYRFIDSVLITKNSQLIFYEQIRQDLDFTDDWGGNNNVNLHILNSVTKSFNSAIIGIAIDQGYIADVSVNVHDYFSHKQPVSLWTEQKSSITLKNWLTMRHGYEWDEWDVSYLVPENLNSQMNNAVDPIQFLLDRPMATVPGEEFAYSTGVSFALGRLLEHATGERVIDFMTDNLFTPLDINSFDYWSLDGQIHTGSALYLTTRDMAKLGQLFLDDGLWNGQQIVSKSWIDESTTRYVDNGSWGYGYQWWMTSYIVNGNRLDTYYADGFGGQYIFVFPQIDAVVTFTGAAYNQDEREQRDISMILQQHILPLLL